MTTTTQFPQAPLAALRDRLLATAADNDRAPQEELDGLSDSVLAAYWHGYLTASRSGLNSTELHAIAFGSALDAPMYAVCTDTRNLRDALARSFQ
ncbi:hypothetical protein [Streptomyces spirodelae]|uniref:Uncharacterized protein n=1 Tax=Streptomyces spirodelae TaxID=2812904 RepID=A0ABS3X4S3_9ACTN|nr:hypothetical protein [Streptomyces spirodelae]MBO8190071.1 hypothetical protein [Streptomyces spirodelae]